MITITLFNVQLSMAAGLFLVGATAFFFGLIVLVARTTGKEVRSLTTQTSELVQKGLAEEVAGLVGNASALLNATNELVRTRAGVGVFLTFLGVFLMAAATWLVFQIK
jgi:hypothetical protein